VKPFGREIPLPVTNAVFSVFASFCATFFASHSSTSFSLSSSIFCVDFGAAYCSKIGKLYFPSIRGVFVSDARIALADPAARGLVEIVVALERVGADRAHARELRMLERSSRNSTILPDVSGVSQNPPVGAVPVESAALTSRFASACSPGADTARRRP
jgi:hypothetical protein